MRQFIYPQSDFNRIIDRNYEGKVEIFDLAQGLLKDYSFSQLDEILKISQENAQKVPTGRIDILGCRSYRNQPRFRRRHLVNQKPSAGAEVAVQSLTAIGGTGHPNRTRKFTFTIGLRLGNFGVDVVFPFSLQNIKRLPQGGVIDFAEGAIGGGFQVLDRQLGEFFLSQRLAQLGK